MTSYYLDTSVALDALLGHSREAAASIDEISADDCHQLISCRLLQTELTRVLRRRGSPVTLRDELLDVVALIPISHGVLAAAEAIEPHVRTVDAVHLGPTIASGIDATVVTHDRTMPAAAGTIGYPTLDPTSSPCRLGQSVTALDLAPVSDHRSHLRRCSDQLHAHLWFGRERCAAIRGCTRGPDVFGWSCRTRGAPVGQPIVRARRIVGGAIVTPASRRRMTSTSPIH